MGLVSGCAYRPAAHPAPIAYAGHQAASWDAVLPGPRVAGAEPGLEYARRDDALNVRDLARAAAEPGPRLEDARRLFVRTRPDTILYFPRDEDRDRHRHPRPWGW